MPNFNFLSLLFTEIWGGSKIKSGSSCFSQTPPSVQIFIRALVRVNAYKYAKFQLHSSISYWDMEGVPKWKLGAADLLRRLLADKFLHGAIVPANAYQHTKFQLPSSNSFRYKEGDPKFNVGATTPLPYPVRWKFYVCSNYLAI